MLCTVNILLRSACLHGGWGGVTLIKDRGKWQPAGELFHILQDFESKQPEEKA